MSSTKYIYQFIPIEFEYLTKTKKIEHKEHNLKTAYLINIIHEIVLKYYFSNKKYIDFDNINDIRFNLWSVILRNKYGMHYSKYIEYLLEKGFMEMVSNYYATKKAKTYRLNYFNINTIKRVKTNDAILAKKNNRDYLENSITNYNNSPIDIKIRKKLIDDLYHVNVDYDNSIKYLNNLKNEGKIELNKYYKNYTSLDSIKNNYLFFKFDEYGRFHTNFTILKREIRQNYIKIDNEEVIELDIKNSQPFFLSILFRNEIPEIDQKEKEIQNFTWLARQGLFYDYFMDKYNNLNRSEIKLLTYKVLFGHNGINSTENKIFQSVFPKIYDYVLEYKEINKDYRFLAHTLQRMESDFIFGKVIKEIYEKIPDIKLFTVHDSISYPIKYKSIVEEIFNRNLKLL